MKPGGSTNNKTMCGGFENGIACVDKTTGYITYAHQTTLAAKSNKTGWPSQWADGSEEVFCDAFNSGYTWAMSCFAPLTERFCFAGAGSNWGCQLK